MEAVNFPKMMKGPPYYPSSWEARQSVRREAMNTLPIFQPKVEKLKNHIPPSSFQ